MGENSAIEWCDHTFNPWVGCTKVGPPCDNCYAEGWAKRTGQSELWNGERRRTTEQNWRQPIKWNAKAKADGVRRRVFCASLADWLDNKVPDSWRDDLANLIEATPHLDWLLLTKRIQNFTPRAPWHRNRVPSNVWLGITCGDQKEFDRDWPKMRELTAVRFISYEPALGPLRMFESPNVYLYDWPEWIIAGGESGPKARPPHPQWFRDLRDDCIHLKIPFLFKQWGEWLGITEMRRRPDGGGPGFGAYDHCRYDQSRQAIRVGKKAAGRLLDGREWNEFFPKL